MVRASGMRTTGMRAPVTYARVMRTRPMRTRPMRASVSYCDVCMMFNECTCDVRICKIMLTR
eukprot:6203460-Pleurochrysis_carterae.AAC.1